MQIFERKNADKLDFRFLAPMISAKVCTGFSNGLRTTSFRSLDEADRQERSEWKNGLRTIRLRRARVKGSCKAIAHKRHPLRVKKGQKSKVQKIESGWKVHFFALLWGIQVQKAQCSGHRGLKLSRKTIHVGWPDSIRRNGQIFELCKSFFWTCCQKMWIFDSWRHFLSHF